jgi:N-acetylmuramoyl-L-alanine amidase
MDKDILKNQTIEGVNYYSIGDFRRLIKTGNYFIDYEHNKLNFNIFEESFIFILNSNFVTSKGRICNLKYPVIQNEQDFLLPYTFFTDILVQFIPGKFSFDEKQDILYTERPVDNRISRIVIDPGHGGKDPGALGKKSYEKDIVLEISQKLKKSIEKEFDVDVLITRNDDTFLTLQERTQFANENQADLFISLHCNAAQNRKSKGVEVFILSTAKTTDARAVEALENSVVIEYEGGKEAVKAYDDLQFILADLQQSEQLEESSDLAVRLQTELIRKTKSLDRGVKQAGFYVLRGAFMPSVLVELGFITNEEEEKKLLSSKYQNEIVKAITSGIKSFKLKYDYLW